MHTRIAIGTAGLLVGLVAGAVAGFGEDSITISKGVWAKFAEYKNQLTPGTDEYFAASTTGGFSWGSDQDKAIQECEQYSNGAKCVLFAHNDQILLEYHVK